MGRRAPASTVEPTVEVSPAERGGASPGVSILRFATLILGAAALFIGLNLLGAPRPLMLAPAVAINLALAFVFARTLQGDREPTISRFARIERGTLEPELRVYTRALTIVWVAYFLIAAALSLSFALFAPSTVRPGAVSLGNAAGVAVLFVGEYAYRRMRFRLYRHASLLTLVRIVAAHWHRGPDER
jgi:uncharacterized membrane protein